MGLLETAIVVVHVLVSLSLVGLVLLQQGKGAEAGASFGAGASQTVFGSQGSGNFLTKMTSYLAVVFFVTSIGLAVIAKEKAEVAAAGEVLAPAPVQQSDDEFNQSPEDIQKALELDVGKPEDLGKDSAPELE